ncbi:hypothetical protein Kpol_1025p5 [Vanderwaltozyma polyspora DSM 70294]|uniref:SPT2 chromatin protein n=1 Tax=Vanderwaltozyma polyspora (strain ATCC 22028 / DSM 70294 / BCRC 21397 / CBS 2163 / NBRC 10782 / NRRL Y-8283 / UCD 57-17) TaxID=436907 RepID=A7TKT1_VANPO|nr:uncharacterized protein Kpol_1025p5 [Vanderwaltozyma polyspora DSM 70294]EDO17086.1 hypothetical protein Kpol_1025p5 [Vanderwaltozyma polyspora DSM 70294]
MSFLSKLSQLKKTPPANDINKKVLATENGKKDERSLLPNNYVREDDPAIARLKQKRRQELIKSGKLNPKGTSNKSRSSSSTPGGKRKNSPSDNDNGTEFKFKRKINSNNLPKFQKPVETKHAPLKKMSFDELMKQAENNAHSKPESEPVLNSKSKELNVGKSVQQKYRISKQGFKSNRNERMHNSTSVRNSRPSPKPHTTSHDLKPVIVPIPKGGGLAKPNEKLRERLEMKKQKLRRGRYEDEEEDEDDYDDDMDDFIDDDEEDYSSVSRSHKANYNRDEIWAMFNKGKSRSDYSYDNYDDYDDYNDMETNELDIMAEEEEAGRMARLEDKREDAWLKKHDDQKRRRKTGK